MTKSDKVKKDNEDYERLVKESYKNKKSSSTPHHTRQQAKHLSSAPQPSNSGCGWILAVIGVICIIFLFHGCSLGSGGYSAPSNPTTPEQDAEYARAEIVKNIHKNEPNIKVYKATVNRGGRLDIYTNIHTLEASKIKHIWTEIYDDRANGNDCDNTKLFGSKDTLLLQGDSQDSGDLNYGMYVDTSN